MAHEDVARFQLPGFTGSLFHPDHPEYDSLRKVYNGMIDRRPAVIARCSSAADVVHAVNLAREDGLTLSVYGTRSPVRQCVKPGLWSTCAA